MAPTRRPSSRGSQRSQIIGEKKQQLTGVIAGLSVVAFASSAEAQQFAPLSETTVKVTETAVFNYHFDNRDNIRDNDKYGEWLNRLNAQATNGPLTLQLRLDSAFYAPKPDPNTLAREDAARYGQLDDEDFILSKTLGYGRNLSQRYINTVYLSKTSLSYTYAGLDVTFGDFYAQLGRGMVLAMRKTDELASDTTLRGVKVDFKPNLGKTKLSFTGLFGLSNPLRVDEVSGRQLWQSDKGVGPFLFPGAPGPHDTFYLQDAQPNFAPDTITGVRLEGGTKQVLFGVQGSILSRGDDARAFYSGFSNPVVSRRVDRVSVGSISASVPNVAEHGSLYAELAMQTLGDPYVDADAEGLKKLSGGKALYVQATSFTGPFTLTLEGKHYDRFFPMMASIANGTLEFQGLQYNGMPTTELITNDTQFEAFNTCVTGGRARLDFRGSEHAIVYGSVGRYATWGEQSGTCGVDVREGVPQGKSDSIRNDVWDPMVGFEVNVEDNRTHLYGSTGIRVDDAAEPLTYDGIAPTTLYYREHWFRYDGVKKIWGPLSVQMAGFHRYRFFPSQAQAPWREGENYLSLIYSPKASVAFGYEYTTKGGERTDFFNGQAQYRISTDKLVRVFVGQTRPALRCVSGVCRQFPAFEGAKVEAVLRF